MTTTYKRKRNAQIRYGWFERSTVPSTHTSKGRRYSRDDICDIVEMVNDGWHILDVAVAFDMGVYRRVGGGHRSTIYNNYVVWNAWYGAYGTEYRRRTATASR